MQSAHIYIIPATDKPTRNPNKMDEMLEPEGKLVINSRQIHRAKNSGSILLVPYHATEGCPMFDSENPIHQIAAAAYELSDIENTIARAVLNVEQKANAVAVAEKNVDSSQLDLVKAEEEYDDAIIELEKLEKLHSSNDEKTPEEKLENDIADIKIKINNAIKEKGIEGVAIDSLEGKNLEELTVRLKEIEDYTPATESNSDDEKNIVETVTLAIGELKKDNKDHWTNDNKPDVNAINAILSELADDNAEKIKISAAQRDEIWAELNKNNDSVK